MANSVSRSPDYSDLDLDFLPHPVTKQLVPKTGEDAIKRAVRNLIFTNFYERRFQPYIGSGVSQLLFENMDPITLINLKDAITVTINNFETRIRLEDVAVEPDYDRNGFNVTITYIILNKNLPVVSSMFLQRIR